MDQLQIDQTRAGWTLCLSVGAIATVLSLLRAPNVWVAVMIISSAHTIFYYLCVKRPSGRGLRTTRDFLLMINNRAMSVAFVLLTFALTFVGIAATGMAITLGHLAGLIGLSLICGILGSRYAATQWRAQSDLESTARNSTRMAMEFGNRYSVLLFATIGTACAAVVNSLGDNIGSGLLATSVLRALPTSWAIW